MWDALETLRRERDAALMDRSNGDIATMTINHYERILKERDEARADAARIADRLSGLELRTTEELARLERERNEAQKELSSIHQWIDRNHPDGFIDSLTYFQNLERVTDNWYDRLDRLEIDAGRFERERDEARHKLELCMAANSDVARIAKERDEALDQVKELIYIAERAIALAEIDFENDKFGVVSELRDGVERIKEAAK